MSKRHASIQFNPEIHNHRSIRLKGYDYSQPGMYFVTICVEERNCRLGEIRDWKIQLSEEGEIVSKLPELVKNKYPDVEINHYVVMPNHIHAIIEILMSDGRGGVTPPLLGKIIAYYKYKTTKLINQELMGYKPRFWQRNYYEHIVKNEDDYFSIVKYIQENPILWAEDHDNPINF